MVFTNPYVGDWPLPNYPAIPNPATAPGYGTTSTFFPKKAENKMDVYMIWAIVPSDPDAPWLVAVWDAVSRSENEDGFLEDLAKQEHEYGARNIRVTRTSVDYDRVVKAFEPVEI
jgi:hypothetical protein